MLDILNPTPSDVDLILGMKKARLLELEKLDRWNEEQANEVVNCALRWNTNHHRWIHDSDTILDLAFDARMPDEVSSRLQRLVAGWDLIGRPDS